MWRAAALLAPGVLAWGVHLYLQLVWAPAYDGLPAAAGCLVILVYPPLGVLCVLGAILPALAVGRLSYRIAVAGFNASFPIWLTILLGPAIWFAGIGGSAPAGVPPPPQAGAPAK